MSDLSANPDVFDSTSPPVSDQPVTTDQQPQGSFWGYLDDEDAGLKNLLSGIQIASVGSRPFNVAVKFSSPAKENVPQRYPNITIKFNEARYARERMHQTLDAYYYYAYLQDTQLNTDGSGYGPWPYPIPMDLRYTVTTAAREQNHHTQIVRALARILNPLWASMPCPGGTYRRIVVESMTSADGYDPSPENNNRRIFRMAYALTIPSEIEPIFVLGQTTSPTASSVNLGFVNVLDNNQPFPSN